MRRLPVALLCGLALRAAAVDGAAPPVAAPLTVYAAASLAGPVQQLADDFRRSHARAVRVSVASTAVLARQIESGARADLFIAADQAWIDYLTARALLQPGSVRDLAGNRLVLIAPAGSKLAVPPGDGPALRAALGDGRLATADPDAVPLGRYARAALRSLGMWDAVAGRLARAEDARAALAFVARGEAPLGIVYATDARQERRVRVIAVLPPSSHPPIVYRAALVGGAAPGAEDLLQFLTGPAARAQLARAGFLPR